MQNVQSSFYRSVARVRMRLGASKKGISATSSQQGVKKVAEGAIIRFGAALVSYNHVVHEDDGNINNQGIEIAALNFLDKCHTMSRKQFLPTESSVKNVALLKRPKKVSILL